MNPRVSFIKFAIMGAIGTVIQYIIMVCLVNMVGTDPGIASTVGAICGAIANYYLNSRYTFNGNKRHAEALPRFILVAGITAVLNGLMVKSLTLLGVNYLISQVFVTVVILGLNFFMSKLWIFKKVQ